MIEASRQTNAVVSPSLLQFCRLGRRQGSVCTVPRGTLSRERSLNITLEESPVNPACEKACGRLLLAPRLPSRRGTGTWDYIGDAPQTCCIRYLLRAPSSQVPAKAPQVTAWDYSRGLPSNAIHLTGSLSVARLSYMALSASPAAPWTTDRCSTYLSTIVLVGSRLCYVNTRYLGRYSTTLGS